MCFWWLGGRIENSGAGSGQVDTVDGHVKKGVWVPGHLHFNLTFLAEADESEKLNIAEEENSDVKWFSFEDALKASTEPWFVEHIYKKLIERS